MPGLVGFVLDVADAFDALSCTSSAMRSCSVFLFDLVGQLIDDDGLALALVNVLEAAPWPASPRGHGRCDSLP